GRQVDLDGADELADLRLVVVDLLLGDEVLLAQTLVAIVVAARGVELRLIARERTLRLVELDLPRPRIDLGEWVALVDLLALGEQHLVEPPVDLRLHGDLLERGDRAEALEPDRKILHLGRGDLDRDHAIARAGGRGARR